MGKASLVAWPAVKALYLLNKYTSLQLARMFGIADSTIRGRALREDWDAEKVIAQAAPPPNIKNVLKQVHQIKLGELGRGAAGRENFRQRIVDECEDMLILIKSFPSPTSDRESALRLDVIEKLEKIGSRCYGFDDKTGVNILINLRALDQEPIRINTPSLED